MKRLFSLALLLSGMAWGQQDRPIRFFPYDPMTSGCSVITPVWNNWVLGKLWACRGSAGTNNGVWTLISQYGNPWLDPGFWKNEMYDVPVDARIGIAVDPDADRLAITNAVGHRPAAISGDIHPPADPDATTYEADAVAGISINKSTVTNGVSGSFFAALGKDGSSGTLNTTGTGVLRLTGPSFLAAWQGSIISINDVEYVITTVNDGDHITLSSSAGTQVNVVWFKRIYNWGLNVLLTDGFPGQLGTPHYKYGYLTNEWDVNIFDATSKLIMHSIGGNGSVQPTVAYGYLVNTLSAASPGTVKWNCGFCLLDGVATAAMQIGVATTGNNSGSMPLLLYSRDSIANTLGGTISTDPNGNILFHPGFTHSGAATNPQTIFLDETGAIALGVSGFVGSSGLVQAGGTARIQAGSDLFANLGAEGAAAEVFCSNCDTPSPAGAVCAASGDHAGALAIRLRGAWHCF